MTNLIQLAWRNLGRNRRRTLITGLALAVGTSLCVASFGLMDGLNADIIRALTRLNLGHVQVHQSDYPRRQSIQLTIPDPGPILKQAQQIREQRGISPRVYGYGLVSHRTKSAGVQLVGVDPKSEPRVTELHKQVTAGEYLSVAPTPWPRSRELTAQERSRDEQITAAAEAAIMAEIEGLDHDGGQAPEAKADTPGAGTIAPGAGHAVSGTSEQWTRQVAAQLAPPPQRPPQIFVGATLAKILKAGVGDRLYIMGQTIDGLAAETFFKIGGIFKTGTEQYDRHRIYLHIQDLQRFLNLDQRIHEITLRGESAAMASVMSEQLKAGLGAAPVLVQTWDEIRPDIKNMLQLNDVSTGMMVVIIFIVAALGVVNTMLMAVFERTRELGMLKAIGMSSGKIVMLIVTETTLLTLMASTVGAAIGVGIDLYMMVYGVDLTSFTEGISFGGMGVAPVIHGVITLKGILVPVVTLGGMCFLAAFYPAVRAARMRPAEGMREV